jgi:uncharacterized protein YfaP (DUF2135 family)
MSRAILIAVLAASITAAASADEIERPVGGWNFGGLTDRGDERAYAYPYSPIDRGGQRYRSLIEGHLKQAGPRKPGALVVNGNAMTLYADEHGRYSRPYAFGAGSNSVEVRDGNGARRRVQFFEANAGRPQPQMRIALAWDDSQAEVDMHVVTPDGQHAFWAQPVLNGGGGLDVDSVDGPGPEMFTTTSPLHGVYHVFVNYWGNFGPSGYHFDEQTREQPIITARVTLVLHENSLQEKRETFVVPLRKIGDLMLVKSFAY